MIVDIDTGLWIWRIDHPSWSPGDGGDRVVTSLCVEEGGEVAVIDALAPPMGTGIWERLDARPPTLAVVLKRTMCAASTSSSSGTGPRLRARRVQQGRCA